MRKTSNLALYHFFQLIYESKDYTCVNIDHLILFYFEHLLVTFLKVTYYYVVMSILNYLLMGEIGGRDYVKFGVDLKQKNGLFKNIRGSAVKISNFYKIKLFFLQGFSQRNGKQILQRKRGRLNGLERIYNEGDTSFPNNTNNNYFQKIIVAVRILDLIKPSFKSVKRVSETSKYTSIHKYLRGDRHNFENGVKTNKL